MQPIWQTMSLLARTRGESIFMQQVASIIIGIGLGVLAWWAVAKWSSKRNGGKVDYKAPQGWVAGLLVALLIIGGTFLMIHIDVNTLSDDELPPINLQVP
jgi:hypothetical protein